MSGLHQTWGNCPHCKERRLVQMPRTNHVLHLLLTVCTCGWWALAWMAVDISKHWRVWHCSTCGTATMPEGKRTFTESMTAFVESLKKGWRATPKSEPPKTT